jgi:hypothetical protein
MAISKSFSKIPRVFFSKNAPNLPFLAQEAKMTTRRTCAKRFATFDHTDCEIIMFEVEIKVFFA